MSAIADKVVDEAEKAVRKVGFVVHQSVTLRTPVDTGYARSNWLVTNGAPSPNVIVPTSLGAGGSTAAQITQESLQAGKAAIERHAQGQDLYITNNVEYIKPLEEGSSAQAPQGMAKQAVVDGKAYAQGLRIDLNV